MNGAELVSGWSDGDKVFVVERSGDDTRIRALPAKWSAFVENLEDDDRRHLQRMREVQSLSVVGTQTRIDFRDRWSRKTICWRIKESAESSLRASGRRGPMPMEADVNP